MSRRLPGYLLLGLLLLTAPAAATTIPDQVVVSSSTEWVTAGSSETAVITVQVFNGSTPLAGEYAVEYHVDPAYGQISPTSGVTDNATGTAAAVFTPATRSGTAPITVRVSYPVGGSTEVVEETLLQQIDHAAPYRIAEIAYLPEVTVAETTNITVRMEDRYGNPVDGRRVAETVYFMAGSPTGSAGFWDGGSYTEEITQPVDAAGNVTVTLKVDWMAGENVVWVDPPPGIADRYLTVYGKADGVPYSITQSVSPSTCSLPADGVSTFSFTYVLHDQYGNPAGGRGLWVNTSIGGEDRQLTTNSQGVVMITYGPKDTKGTVNITATVVDNATVTVTRQVEFTSTAPVDMLLSASPQTMPSRDVDPSVVSYIRAKVMDIKGNPVFGETVTFQIQNVDVGIFNQTDAPYLSSASAVTDNDGYAVVQFAPGAFTTDRDDPGYSQTATGTCDVVATWGSVSRTIPVAWKNYPYISVETFVEPETVEVNDTIDVTVRLRGDGWALQPDPIDVVLVIDRSGSMSRDNPPRISCAKDAAKTFISQMDPLKDKIGVVSYSSNATLDLSLTYDYSTVSSIIDGLSTGGYTATRKALYTSIQEMIANRTPDPEAVQAVILMTDGEFNYYGDPLARGRGYTDYWWWYPYITRHTWFSGLGGQIGEDNSNVFTEQNMSIFATNNNISIYTISFSDDIVNGSTTWNTLETLAEATGGRHYHAESGEQLTQVYTEIAGELKTEAGVNTTMDISFENVEVNSTPVAGDQVFDYVYADGVSTLIYSYNDTATIIPAHTRDDTANWTTNRVLPFDIGTIRLEQVWEATFRLKVKKDGNINVFGPNSTITFNNGTDSLDLPDMFITAIPDLNNTGVDFRDLSIWGLTATGAPPYHELLPLQWNVNYTGTSTVTEEIAYSSDGGYTWVLFDTKTADNTTSQDSTHLDVRDLPGGEYLIRVHAYAPDTPDAWDQLLAPVRVGAWNRAYIQLQ